MRYTHLIVNPVPGRGSGFSLEAPEGMRLLTRSRLLTDKEQALLGQAADVACARPSRTRLEGTTSKPIREFR